MPSLSFKQDFVPGIVAMLDDKYAHRTGIKPKITTIRAKRKRPLKKGDKLYLFSGLRTKQCRRLGVVICPKTEDIGIKESLDGAIIISIDGLALNHREADRIAKQDGFSSGKKMIEWFKSTHGLPFEGQRIYLVNTYNRKYFCTKKVKDHGFTLKLETTQKTILVNQDDVAAAKTDRYIKELSSKHNYGVQIINPLFT